MVSRLYALLFVVLMMGHVCSATELGLSTLTLTPQGEATSLQAACELKSDELRMFDRDDDSAAAPIDDLSFLDDLDLSLLEEMPDFHDEPFSISDIAQLTFLYATIKKNEYLALASEHVSTHQAAYSTGFILMSMVAGLALYDRYRAYKKA